jgi:hypothetical protein
MLGADTGRMAASVEHRTASARSTMGVCINAKVFIVRNFGLLMVTALGVLLGLNQAATGQVNLQYDGQYSGQYNGQYDGRFNGQFSGQYYGRGSDETASPTVRDRRYGISGYPVNSGECGELYYPSPGTDYVSHDSQGRRCY